MDSHINSNCSSPDHPICYSPISPPVKALTQTLPLELTPPILPSHEKIVETLLTSMNKSLLIIASYLNNGAAQ